MALEPVKMFSCFKPDEEDALSGAATGVGLRPTQS